MPYLSHKLSILSINKHARLKQTNKAFDLLNTYYTKISDHQKAGGSRTTRPSGVQELMLQAINALHGRGSGHVTSMHVMF